MNLHFEVNLVNSINLNFKHGTFLLNYMYMNTGDFVFSQNLSRMCDKLYVKIERNFSRNKILSLVFFHPSFTKDRASLNYFSMFMYRWKLTHYSKYVQIGKVIHKKLY